MSNTKHHAIAVTCYRKDMIQKAHKKATEIFKNRVSNILESDYNGFSSFFIAPDGSKEYWEASDLGDAQRKKFKNWIKKQAFEDGSSPISFCEFFYGDDNGESSVVEHN